MLHSLIKISSGFPLRSWIFFMSDVPVSFATSTSSLFSIHLIYSYGSWSMRISTLYSFSSLYFSTSNCSTPTTPTMISSIPLWSSWNICMAPSWAIWVIPFTNCFLFMVSTCLTLAKCSGAKVGIPSYFTSIPGAHTVSPIEKIPGSNTPIMSPP